MPDPLRYIDVAPLTSVPLTRDAWFSYTSPIDIPVGSLVEVPLGARRMRGIVTNNLVTRKANFRFIKFKSVGRVIQESFLTAEQLSLARYISESCFTPLGVCLKHFVPTHFPKTATKEKKLTLPETHLAEKPILFIPTADQLAVFKKIISRRNISRPRVLFGPPAAGKTETALHAFSQALKSAEQGLFLVPETALLTDLEQRAGKYWSEDEIVVLHGRLTPAETQRAWEHIRSGRATIILGTRQALFAPFTRLRMIALDDEHSESYKQWNMAPRYDARLIAQQLARIYRASLLFISSTPSLTSWYALEEKQFTSIPLLTARTARPQCTTIDLRLERWKKNFSSLSAPLTEAIDTTLAHHSQALLFVNHQGMSTFSICVNCKNTLRCPECDRALVLSREGHYYCLHCSYKTDAFPTCSHCRHSEFRNIGIGTERVERELEKKFPRARIARLDRTTLASPKRLADIVSRFTAGTIDILIGTQAAVLGWNLPNLSLIGIIDAESLFALPDFHSDEKAFQLLTQAVYRSARFARDADMPAPQALIQTFHPENPLFEAVGKYELSKWYDRLLADRRALHYPPATRGILLVGRHADAKKLEALVKKQYTLLVKLQQSALPSLRITPPQKSFLSKQRGLFRQTLLIRLPHSDLFPPELSAILKKLPDEWSIDIDPISFL
ncbi:MAG: primosomal protein N' [Candidatus Moraniibacteriota bacterium]